MSLAMNMRIDGVAGDSRSFRHKGWFEVLSWNWGMSSNRRSAQETGAKTTLNEISIIKQVGDDSIDIRRLFAEGKIIPGIEFNISPVTGKRETHKNYVDIRLEDVAIKSIVTGGNTDDSFFKEHITLLFDRITFECNRLVPDSSESPGEAIVSHEFSWDVSGNKEWIR